MAYVPRRRTAIVTITLPGVAAEELRPLDAYREYRFELRLDGRTVEAGLFRSPFGDEQWRQVLGALRTATDASDGADPGTVRAARDKVEDGGKKLHQTLRGLGPALAAFLADGSAPRRLVIQSQRPEIHALPWEAMIEDASAGGRRIPAQDDLSIVRCAEAFDETTVPVPARATVRVAVGRGVEGRTVRPFEWLAAEAGESAISPVVVRAGGDPTDLTGDIVSLEAHGDTTTGEVDTGETSAAAASAVDALKDRRMLLIWSCHSGFMRAEGNAVALRLQKQRNTFVLVFATPLRFETSGRLADEIVRACFNWRSAVDPETAVVRSRARLYADRPRACEWAALTLWLRAPLDLSALALSGPRVLPGSGEPVLPDTESQRLQRVMASEALSGRMVLLPRCAVAGAIAPELVRHFRGAVVHVRAGGTKAEMRESLRQLEVSPPSAHRADAFLSIFDHLALRPQSLIVWSGVGDDEIRALQLLDEAPRHLAIVLATPSDFGDVVGFATLREGEASTPLRLEDVGPPDATPLPNPAGTLAALEQALERGEHEKAVDVWRRTSETARDLDEADRVRLHVAGYWALVRIASVEEAGRCAAEVERVDRFEGLLLHGNLAERDGRHDLAARAYAEAAGLATDDFRRARVALEQGWPFAQTGDAEAAERLYRRALTLLEAITDREGDFSWGSTLGRALRDYADLIAARPDRAQECLALLRRAVMVHALDGRMNQVAAVLKTRAKLERTRGHYDRAERALVTAAAVLHECGNRSGWLDTAAFLAELALESGDLAHAVALARAAVPKAGPNRARVARARLAMAAAHALWRMGELEEAARWAAEVDDGSVSRRDVRFAHDLAALLEALRA